MPYKESQILVIFIVQVAKCMSYRNRRGDNEGATLGIRVEGR